MSEVVAGSAPKWVRLAARLIPWLPAGRYRAIARLGRNPPPTFRMRMPPNLGSQWFLCDLRDSIAREVCFTGLYEPQETAVVRAVLKPGMTFVDVGANWGYFTLLAAHLVGHAGRVLSLEPDPRLFQTLSSNLAMNRLSQVRALQLAAADAPGLLSLAGFDESQGNFGLSRIVESKNPKSEARNPKQIQNTKSQISNQEVPDIGASDLGFVSDFGFRISDLAISSDRGASQDAIISRARGLAVIRLAESGRADQPSRSRLTKEALPLLDEAVKSFPEDVAALQARGYALWQQNRKEEAGASFQAGLKLAPENETTLIYAASLAAEMGQVDQAVGLWRRAVQVNPWNARSHFELARLFIIRKEWASAVDESREVLRLNPFHTEARKILIVCYQQIPDPQNARAEFRRLMELNPPNPQRLQEWFDGQGR